MRLPLLFLLFSSSALALPSLINQEGLLTDNQGRPHEGPAQLRFSLYGAAEGGAVLWFEEHNLDLTMGYYNVVLGTQNNITAALAGDPRFLEVSVDGVAMLPRIRLLSVPYALQAQDVLGDIHPQSLSINEQMVINNQGHWVGDPTGLVGPAGPAGAEGAMGPQGPEGPAGPAGGDGSPDSPLEVLAKLVQVDGGGSGLDVEFLDGQPSEHYLQVGQAINADTLGGQAPAAFVRSGADLLDRLLPVDGANSGVDADLLDGLDSAAFIQNGEQVIALVLARDGINSGLDADRLDGLDSSAFVQTAEQILALLLTQDGTGSGLDADRLDGHDTDEFMLVDSPATAAQILAQLLTVDGSNSSLDADRLDGLDSTTFLNAADPGIATQILNLLLNVDGAGTGLDADLLDGLQSSKFMRVDANTGTSGSLAVGTNLNITGALSGNTAQFGGTLVAARIEAPIIQTEQIQFLPLDQAPNNPQKGLLYFNNQDNDLQLFNGQEWTSLACGGCQGPAPANCGNGSLDDGEECDDGNLDDGDGCSSACESEQLAGGCSNQASFSAMIAPDLWLCAYNNSTGKTWPQTYSVCNEAGGFYLATVGPMTRRGAPTDEQIAAAMALASANNHDYITTGQPARSCDWEGTNYESCNGLGYLHVNNNSSSSNWLALVDGNTNGLRSWPSANHTGAHRLASLCQNASGDPQAYIFDHRWR